MRNNYDLSQLDWQLSGWMPHQWRALHSMEIGAETRAEIYPVSAAVPGSVHGALRQAGKLPDWNVGLNHLACEWVENRHWVFQAVLPDDWLETFGPGKKARLRCEGLDYAGWLLVNRKEAATFKGSFVPHIFDITDYLQESGNVIQIIFDTAPRWMGQCGYTSQMTDWKPRFNYTWDWTPRILQAGIWDAISLEITDADALGEIRCTTDIDLNYERPVGMLNVKAVQPEISGEAIGDDRRVRVTLSGNEEILAEEYPLADIRRGIRLDNLHVTPWYPNLYGEQPLYNLKIELLGASGQVLDAHERRVGFKHVEWQQCENAPEGAEPWICVVNGRRVFLQGVNWTPVLPNFADVDDDDYRTLLGLYRDMGCTVLRVWGGAFLEKEIFYDLCDEYGLLVWQEFPLSSSGHENWPTEDPKYINELCNIARSYIRRRQHHASLLMWSGGNELQGTIDGGKAGCGKPIDYSHPLMQKWRAIVSEEDPGRRFVPTSASGPRFVADEKDFGKGLHHDVHGPWAPPADMEKCKQYWANDDALFRSEAGAPSPSPVDIIENSAGDLEILPATSDRPLWRRPISWWTEWPVFVKLYDREPKSLEEFVTWGQERQKEALSIAAQACKNRFPGIGGFIIWMGHDCFPCAANTAIIDFYRRPKPAVEALTKIFRRI